MAEAPSNWIRAERYEPLPPSRAARWANWTRKQDGHFARFVGIELEEVRVDYARMRLSWRTELSQTAGIMQGGVLCTLLDSVVVPAIGSGYDDGRPYVTLNLNVQFMAAVRDEDVLAQGWVVKRGRTVVYCESQIHTVSGLLAAAATTTYSVTPPG